MRTTAALAIVLWLVAAAAPAELNPPPGGRVFDCFSEEREAPALPLTADDAAPPDSVLRRLLDYTELAVRHRLSGLASYYANFFDGRKTANGEVFRNRQYSAAHLTLPLGTWIEVTSRATGRKLRMRVNDRGPYARKFVLDLSQAAARYLGVDRAADRYVEVRVSARPGEEPLPEEPEVASAARVGSTD